MPTRPGPFLVMEIARALARLSGRVEVDLDEAYRITDDMAAWYLRGEFSEHEVVALAGEPGEPPILRTIAEIANDAQRRGESYSLSQQEWRMAWMLTAPAARRYVDGCGLAGAPRVSREWFGSTDISTPEAGHLKTGAPSKGHRGTRGPKPVVRNAIADNMFEDLRKQRRTPEELRDDTLAVLVAQYGSSQNTARAAREDALTRFSKFQDKP